MDDDDDLGIVGRIKRDIANYKKEIERSRAEAVAEREARAAMGESAPEVRLFSPPTGEDYDIRYNEGREAFLNGPPLAEESRGRKAAIGAYKGAMFAPSMVSSAAIHPLLPLASGRLLASMDKRRMDSVAEKREYDKTVADGKAEADAAESAKLKEAAKKAVERASAARAEQEEKEKAAGGRYRTSRAVYQVDK